MDNHPDSEDPTPSADTVQEDGTDSSRLQLLWDVLVFQFKLVADGIRDVFLSPISIISAIMGLIAGGDKPDRYFKQVLRLGRRTELFINLFGYRRHIGTSDDLIEPLKKRVFAEAQNNPWVTRVGTDLNRKLDNVNASIASKNKPGDTDKSDAS